MYLDAEPVTGKRDITLAHPPERSVGAQREHDLQPVDTERFDEKHEWPAGGNRIGERRERLGVVGISIDRCGCATIDPVAAGTVALTTLVGGGSDFSPVMTGGRSPLPPVDAKATSAAHKTAVAATAVKR